MSTETQERAFARNSAAFDLLQRFETAIRDFITDSMAVTFGEAWMDGQVAKDIVDRWRSKQSVESDAIGGARSLIHYADFTDYKAIIERSDNWRQVFRPVFRRLSDVQESFQRLFPLRIKTMHARMLTEGEALLVSAEIRRVLHAIDRAKLERLRR